ncbi:hypothetical protein [Sphingopyxis sp.]|jgi:hypothetical protein
MDSLMRKRLTRDVTLDAVVSLGIDRLNLAPRQLFDVAKTAISGRLEYA